MALKWDSEHCFVLNPLSLLVIIKLFATGPNGFNNNDETDQLILLQLTIDRAHTSAIVSVSGFGP